MENRIFKDTEPKGAFFERIKRDQAKYAPIAERMLIKACNEAIDNNMLQLCETELVDDWNWVHVGWGRYKKDVGNPVSKRKRWDPQIGVVIRFPNEFPYFRWCYLSRLLINQYDSEKEIKPLYLFTRDGELVCVNPSFVAEMDKVYLFENKIVGFTRKYENKGSFS